MVLVLVIVLLILELADAIVGFLPVFSRPLVGLLIVAFILLWYVDRR